MPIEMADRSELPTVNEKRVLLDNALGRGLLAVLAHGRATNTISSAMAKTLVNATLEVRATVPRTPPATARTTHAHSSLSPVPLLSTCTWAPHAHTLPLPLLAGLPTATHQALQSELHHVDPSLCISAVVCDGIHMQASRRISRAHHSVRPPAPAHRLTSTSWQ